MLLNEAFYRTEMQIMYATCIKLSVVDKSWNQMRKEAKIIISLQHHCHHAGKLQAPPL